MTKMETCSCKKIIDLKIMTTFQDNVFYCMNCNLPVIRENISQEIKNWKEEYELIYKLWLFSGVYENWAGSQLENCNSKINKKGIKLAKFENCFYWIHNNNANSSKTIENNCTICDNPMEKYNSKVLEQRICRNCNIVLT